MFSVVYFEISGKCNGKCPWCTTGRKNNLGIHPGGFIKPGRFQKALRYLKHNKLIEASTIIKLFNWGEPLLHPQFKEIVQILNDENLPWAISTNASKVVYFDHNNSLKNLKQVIISMSGFSQKSYDKAHGFKFDTIRNNIVKLVENWRNHGFTGVVQLAYHLYQHNINEVEDIFTFCKENQFTLCAGLAYINDWEEYRNYLNSTMEYEKLKQASQMLFLSHIPEKLKEHKQATSCKCPQFNLLSIDEECNVITCCLVDRDLPGYTIGNLFNLTRNDIVQKKTQQNICKECHESGIWYLVQNPLSPINLFTVG